MARKMRLEFEIREDGTPSILTVGVRSWFELLGVVSVLREVALEAHGVYMGEAPGPAAPEGNREEPVRYDARGQHDPRKL
jgi:hypothetical protein